MELAAGGRACAGLIAWSYDNRLLWLVLATLVMMLSLLAAIGVMVLRFAQKRVRHPAFKLALSRITRNPAASGAQLGALATSFMLLTIIWLLRTDLLEDWQQTLPPDAPNVFALNIAKSELDDYVGRLDTNSLNARRPTRLCGDVWWQATVSTTPS